MHLSDKNKLKIEILAPAGGMDSLTASINCGADAVYIGGSKFSARKNAQNFTDDEVKLAVEYAHLRGAKVHVAVNTLIHESELKNVFEYLKFLSNIGIDAVIVQDMGVLNIAKEYFPNLELHASTQITVHNLDGAIQAKNMGFKRVVLARELSFNEIKHIAQNCGIETEVFAHGALCMCYSGQCLMSSVLGARSGNRGFCAQPCRLEYTLCDSLKKPISEKERYLLSLKDMCLADEIKKLADANVTSLKIEGRMKSPLYSALTSYVYSKAKQNGTINADDINMLENIFSRNGFTKGYFNKAYGRDMLNYSSNCDDIYKNQSKDVLDFAENLIKSSEVKRKVSGTFKAKLGMPLCLSLECDGYTVSQSSQTQPQPALKTPTGEDRIKEQIFKTGGTAFEFEKLDIITDEGINIPIKAINELRRDAFLSLEQSILKTKDNQSHVSFNYTKTQAKIKNCKFTCEVMTYEQAKSAHKCGFERIYIPFRVYEQDKAYFNSHPDVFYLMCENIEREGFITSPEKTGLKNICISNISGLNTFKGFNLHANYSLNAFNSYSAKELKKYGITSVCLSPELNIMQIKEASPDMDFELIAYGRLRLMTVQNCIVKSALNGCKANCGDGYFLLKDRKNMFFPVFTQKGQCINSIYNSLPVYMGDRMAELKKTGAKYLRFVFTTEGADDIPKIKNMYEKGEKYFNDEYTRGHFSRGVL